MSADHVLPAELARWIEETAGGEIARLTRHAARREAWIVDMKPDDAGERRYFLRFDRAAMAGRPGTRGLRRETTLLRELAARDFPSQKIIGWNEAFCAALQSFVPGEADLSRAPPPVRHTVMMDFMAVLARLHRMDIKDLALPEFVVPRSPLEHSLLEIEAIEAPPSQTASICKTSALAAFGKRWLINHAPATAERTVLLQGDTGPANFLYEPMAPARVSAVIDWEWAHFGDPLEDLGNIWVRNFFCPSVDDLTPYFRHYSDLAGITLDRAKIEYYRIHQLVRSVFGLGYSTASLDWQEPASLYLAYKAIIELQTIRAMMEAGDLDGRDASSPLADPGESDNSLHVLIARQLDGLVLPHLTDEFAHFIVEGHVGLIRYLERLQRLSPQIEEIERAGLVGILGSPVTDLDTARSRLIAHIEGLSIADEEPVLRHLHRMALVQAMLLEPLMGPWSTASWARLDL